MVPKKIIDVTVLGLHRYHFPRHFYRGNCDMPGARVFVVVQVTGRWKGTNRRYIACDGDELYRIYPSWGPIRDAHGQRIYCYKLWAKTLIAGDIVKTGYLCGDDVDLINKEVSNWLGAYI